MAKLKEIDQSICKPIFREQLVTIGDLEEFKNDLFITLRQLICEHKYQAGKQWVKSYEVKKLLGISTGTLQHLRASGTLPYSKIGGIVYYDTNEINKVLNGKKRVTSKGVSTPIRSIKS